MDESNQENQAEQNDPDDLTADLVISQKRIRRFGMVVLVVFAFGSLATWILMMFQPNQPDLFSSFLSMIGIQSNSKQFHELTNDDLKTFAQKQQGNKTIPELRLGDCPHVTDEGVNYVRNLPIYSLNAPGSGIAGTTFAQGWPALVVADLARTHIKKGLPNLDKPPKLVAIGLADDGLTDQDLDALSNFGHLKNLVIDDNKITNQGLLKLSGIRSLRLILAKHTDVTPDGVATFEKQRPNCKVMLQH